MDFLDTIGTFVRVAQLHSFSRAADELDVTQSRVSKHVAMLEARFGARLFDRTTRRVRLTEEGSRFLAFAQRMLDDVAVIETSLGDAKATPSGLVKIGSPSAFARRYLVESAKGILARYPGLRIEIVTGDLSEDLVEQGIDMAIRFGEVRGGTIAKRVGTVARILIASPDYVERAGMPETVAALQQHECLVYLNPNAGSNWIFTDGSARQRIDVTGHLQSNSAEVIKEACLAGSGIALMPSFLFEGEIEAGRLHQLLPAVQPEGLPIMLAYASRSFVPPKVRVVVDALTQDMKTALKRRRAP